MVGAVETGASLGWHERRDLGLFCVMSHISHCVGVSSRLLDSLRGRCVKHHSSGCCRTPKAFIRTFIACSSACSPCPWQCEVVSLIEALLWSELVCETAFVAGLASSTSEERLFLGLLAIPQRSDLFLGHIVRSMYLVERVVWVLLELFANLIDLLLSPQTLLVLHLFQSSLLESSICCLESPLGVAVDLVFVVGRQCECIESVVDTSGIQCCELFLR